MGLRGPNVDPQFVAQIVVDASVIGDEAAAKRHNVSTKTVCRYRHMAETDEAVSKLVSAKWAAADKDWSAGLSAAIKAQIDFLNRAAAACDPMDPESVKAVTGALETLSEVAITSKVLDARIAGARGQAGEAAGQAAGPGEEPRLVH